MLTTIIMGIDSLKVEPGRVGSWNASWNFLEFSSVLVVNMDL